MHLVAKSHVIDNVFLNAFFYPMVNGERTCVGISVKMFLKAFILCFKGWVGVMLAFGWHFVLAITIKFFILGINVFQ